MADDYTPPKVWSFDAENGGEWAKQNRPTAGATHDKELPQGDHNFQLYSLATPNGQKATIMFEELLELGESGAEYDAYLINIREGDQFSSGFVEINPNSKIPAMIDLETGARVFESANIVLYLANKFGQLLPKDIKARTEAMNWLFWLQGSAPYLGGGFGHFFSYSPYRMQYPIDRYTMEVKRQLDVLDRHLAENRYLAGEEYSIADIVTWPWYGGLVRGALYDAAEFVDAASYKNLTRWANEVAERPAVKRGRMVNRSWGEKSEQLVERHDASDFDLRTEDKLNPES